MMKCLWHFCIPVSEMLSKWVEMHQTGRRWPSPNQRIRAVRYGHASIPIWCSKKWPHVVHMLAQNQGIVYESGSRQKIQKKSFDSVPLTLSGTDARIYSTCPCFSPGLTDMFPDADSMAYMFFSVADALEVYHE